MFRLAVALVVASLAELPATPSHGWFSASATSIRDARILKPLGNELFDSTLTVRSPDGRSQLTVSTHERLVGKEQIEQVTRMQLSGRAGSFRFQYPMDVSGDALWSPDSRRIALSIYGGGTVGGHRVFIVDANGKREISQPIFTRFAPPKTCDLGRFASIGVVKWLSPTRLLIAARQSHLEICPQRNRTLLYAFNLATANIERTYTLEEARRQFAGSLGDLLR